MFGFESCKKILSFQCVNFYYDELFVIIVGQSRFSHLERKHNSVEMELYQTRLIASQLDTEAEEEEADASLYKER